jgi:hypothetical protein
MGGGVSDVTDHGTLAATILQISAGLFALIFVALVLLKVAYAGKSHRPLPAKKPGICWLPKYAFLLQLDGPASIEDELILRLQDYGFEVAKRDARRIVFSRGSALGEFSIEITKLIATATLPLSNPVEMQIEYGIAFGCLCDTGDLWKFCRELMQKVEDRNARASEWNETGNPYQSPPV